MAAQCGTRDKILRVSAAYRKGKKFGEKCDDENSAETLVVWECHRYLVGGTQNPFVGHAALREGKIRLCAEINRMEEITWVHVSQLWPLCLITKE